MAKFDTKFATKPLYAGVGATDLAVERVRELVSGAQKRTQKRVSDAQQTVSKVELEPKALRDQAVNRVDALAKDAKARRAAIEKRVSDAQAGALATVNGTYDGLVSRGENLVTRIRRQDSTQAATSSAKTAATKAKSTRTQATKAAKSTATTAKTQATKASKTTADNAKATAETAKKSTAATKKTAAKKSAPVKSSAKSTATAAKQTASNATQAAGDAAAKVGD